MIYEEIYDIPHVAILKIASGQLPAAKLCIVFIHEDSGLLLDLDNDQEEANQHTLTYLDKYYRNIIEIFYIQIDVNVSNTNILQY